MIKDILLKAAEDVTQGMWCIGSWFEGLRSVDDSGDEGVFDSVIHLSTEKMQRSRRCAEGSILLATRLLGGTRSDYVAAVKAVEKDIGMKLCSYNDEELTDDPFEAGAELAEIFRTTAERL